MEEIESGALEEISPESQVEETNTEASTDGSVQQTKQTSTELPFHDHPRWKEVIEQKNEALSKAKALEERYAQMEARLTDLSRPKDVTPDKRAAMIARLKGIDPEFAEFVSELTPSKEVEQLKNEYRQMQEQSFVNQAVSTVNKMHADNKVSPELQAKYNAELDLAYRTGNIKSQADVATFYKQVHDGYSKLIENIKRAERESYVATKKGDAKTPASQPKSSTSNKSGNKQQEWSKDPEERRAQIVAKYLKTKSADAL